MDASSTPTSTDWNATCTGTAGDSTEASAAAELDILWLRLREINASVTSVDEQIRDNIQHHPPSPGPPDGLVDDPESTLRHELFFPLRETAAARDKDLRAAKTRREGQRDDLRTTIHARVRSKLRPLKIMDLPNELLMCIFAHARRSRSRDGLFSRSSFEPRPRFADVADTRDIRNLRLACRRFCDTSSHLLLRSVHVNLVDPSSLVRLEEVSRHPTISKGIQAVVVVLQYYSSIQVEDIRTFAACQASNLADLYEAWRMHPDSYLDWSQTHQNAKEEVSRIRDS